jgi:RNA polymerase primary sigma factor
MMDESVKIDIERALSMLHPREAEITRLYFGIGREHPLTLEEIGKRFDLTRERVRQIKEKALRKLRQRHRREDLQTHIG